jgi:two-component system, NarL family, response regulator YdfI
MNGKAESGSAIRVLVSAHSALRRAELEAIVRNSEATKLAGSIYGLDGFSRQARDFHPDVLLADIGRADSLALSRSSALDDDNAPLSAVAVTDNADLRWVIPALRNGMKSVLSRDASGEEIITAIKAAFAGLVLLEPDVMERILQNFRPAAPGSPSEEIEALTAREIEVLRMLGDGLANKAIATRLGISEHTVKFHISSVLSKNGCGEPYRGRNRGNTQWAHRALARMNLGTCLTLNLPSTRIEMLRRARTHSGRKKSFCLS